MDASRGDLRRECALRTTAAHHCPRRCRLQKVGRIAAQQIVASAYHALPLLWYR